MLCIATAIGGHNETMAVNKSQPIPSPVARTGSILWIWSAWLALVLSVLLGVALLFVLSKAS